MTHSRLDAELRQNPHLQQNPSGHYKGNDDKFHSQFLLSMEAMTCKNNSAVETECDIPLRFPEMTSHDL